jgi:hypothetical protein
VKTWLVLLLSAGGDIAIAAVLVSLGYLIPGLILLVAAVGVAGFAVVLRGRGG